MALAFVLLTLLLLAVTVFALQNAQLVTVKFLAWQVEASVAVLTLAAAAAGALAAGLVGLATRLRRWRLGPAAAGTPAGPPTRPAP